MRRGAAELFAMWRFQAHGISGGIHKRGFKKLSKKLDRISAELEAIWVREFGDYFLIELERLYDQAAEFEELSKDQNSADPERTVQ